MSDGLKEASSSLGTEALMLVNEVGARETVALLLSAAGTIAHLHGITANDFVGMVEKLKGETVYKREDAK